MIKDFADISSLFPWFFSCGVFVFGAIIGSFLNVCILRIPAGRSVVRPGSHCACGAPIRWYNNIPIISWFILRGRAPCCGRSFSIRYAAIELLTAVLFLCAWQLLPPAKAACGMVLVSCLICATFIDLDHMEIPDVFSIGLAVTGVVLSFAVPSLHSFGSGIFLLDSLRSGTEAIIGALVGAGLVLWIAMIAESVLKKEAMGLGDVKFVGAIGAFTGWQGTLTAVFGGALVGTVWFALALIWQKIGGRKARSIMKAENQEGDAAELGVGALVPYGPMLAIAGGLHFLWLHRYVDAYFAQLSVLFK